MSCHREENIDSDKNFNKLINLLNLLAEKYGADANAVAGLVVVSTLITVAISPILLTFLVV